jgi:hypothetical protein
VPTETPQVVRPKAVDTAFLLTVAGIVLFCAGTTLTELMDRARLTQLIRQTLAEGGRAFTEDDVLRLIGPFRLAGGIGIVLSGGLLVLVAIKMRAGRNWARLLLTGFALFGMVNFLASVSASGAALDLIWNLGAVAFAVAGVIYLFRPDSVKYFTGHRRHR